MRQSSKLLALILCCVTIMSRHSFAAPPAFLEIDDWEVSDEVMASSEGVSVTEREFLAFCMMTSIFPPDELLEWRDFTRQRKSQLRKALRTHLETRLFAERWTPLDELAGDSYMESLGARLYAGPVAAFLYGRLVLPDQVHIFPEDLYYHYTTSDDYQQPETKDIVLVKIPVSNPQAMEVINRARDLTNSLREAAIETRGLENALTSDPAFEDLKLDRLTIGGPDGAIIPRRVRDRIDFLSISQFSQPIQTDAAFYLVELLDVTDEEPVPFEEALPDLKKDVLEKLLPLQYDVQLIERLIKARADNLTPQYEFLDDDVKMIKVKRFELHRDEFRRLFPEAIGDRPRPNTAAVTFQGEQIFFNEAAHQWLEEFGYDSDPLMQTALEEGRLLFRSGDYIRRERGLLDPSFEELEEYLEKNRDKVAPEVSNMVWRFQIRPRVVNEHQAIDLAAMQVIMRSRMDQLIQEGGRLLRERSLITGSEGVENPTEIINRLDFRNDSRLEITFQPIGTVNANNARQLVEVPYEDLKMGEFTASVGGPQGSIVSYYVSNKVESPPLTDIELYELTKLFYTVDKVTEGLKELLNVRENDGAIRYHPDL